MWGRGGGVKDSGKLRGGGGAEDHRVVLGSRICALQRWTGGDRGEEEGKGLKRIGGGRYSPGDQLPGKIAGIL